MEERESNDLDYHLNDPEDIKEQILINNRKKNIITGIAIFLIILFLCIFGYLVYYLFSRKTGQKSNEKLVEKPNEKSMFSSQLDIPYGENIIENTFKTNGCNFNQILGDINKGENYGRNPNKNKYDLFIPNNLDKNQYNKIILLIHGGAWNALNKTMFWPICESMANLGYIAATKDFTLLNDANNNPSIFRILDEVAAAIKSIKKNLKDKGFNEKKLELAIGGGSSGSHIALLYAYSYKNSPMEIKFVINLVGPVTLEEEYFYQIKNLSKPLESITEEFINNAKMKKRLNL